MHRIVTCCSALLVGLVAANASAQSFVKLDVPLNSRANLLTGRSYVLVRPLSPWVDVLIQSVGGQLGRSLPLVNARAADVPNDVLSILAVSPLVQRIALDRKTAGLTERTGATVGATAVRETFGYDGNGVGVAVIDSGITVWHDDLTDPAVVGSQRVAEFVDFVGGLSAPYDDYGHGTHVAGIVAGNGFDSGGRRSGIAPRARLVVLKTLDSNGSGRISDVIAALDYVISHKAQFNIRVVNLSIAASISESYTTDLLAQATKRAVDEGIVVVAAAGNNGRGPNGHAQYGGVAAPGNAPWVLTVGASSHMGTINRDDDVVASFSSRGPTRIDYLAKPDLVAPGVGIESLSVPGSRLYSTYSAYLLSGTAPTSYPPYLSQSGTSMSAPVVSGTVALMLQANPSLTPNAVKSILQYTAQAYAGYDSLTQGAGFLNAAGAVQLAQYFSQASTSEYPSDPTWGGQIIWSNRRIQGGRLAPNVNAWALNTEWGSATATNGAYVAWGLICSTANCDAGGWATWGISCSDATCTTMSWGGDSPNVVWGSHCGGGNCSGTAWSADDAETVVWGTNDYETVVWGTSDEETVVWGTGCGDACEPVIWNP